jgi:hypothetical protein
MMRLGFVGRFEQYRSIMTLNFDGITNYPIQNVINVFVRTLRVLRGHLLWLSCIAYSE